MIAHAHAYLRGHWLRHTERKNLLMNLLGLLTAVEFFENVMFIFGAAHIMGGVDAAPEEFVHAQAAYAVGSLMAMVLQQRLARRFGYRRYLACAMLLFVLGLLGCARSANISQMVVARLVQGAGGGAFFTSSRVLVTLLFAPADRPRALKRFMLLIFGGSALAPVCAAWLIESWGWAWVFYGVLPAALLAGAGVLLLPDGAGRMARAQPLHMAAMPLAWFALAVVCLQVAVSQARLDVLAHPARLVLVGAAGVLLLAGFLWWQWRHPEPLLHLRMLHNPVYLMGLGLYFVHYFLSNFSAYLFPIYAERGLGLPLAATGWLNSLAALASLCVAWTYIRFFARRLVHKRPVMLVGLSCMALCAWSLSRMPAGVDAMQLMPALLAKGAFGALLVLPVAGLTFRELDDERFAHGYLGKNLMRQIATSAASACAAVMLQNRQFALREVLSGQLSPVRAEVGQWLDSMAAWLTAQGLDPAQAHTGAMAALAATVDGQAMLLACEDMYRLLALLACVAVVVVVAQRRLL